MTTAHNGFAFKPGENTNPHSWLGVAMLVRGRFVPILDMMTGRPLATRELAELPDETLQNWVRLARNPSVHEWRRVLLPMLLEEAKKRGIDV